MIFRGGRLTPEGLRALVNAEDPEALLDPEDLRRASVESPFTPDQLRAQALELADMIRPLLDSEGRRQLREETASGPDIRQFAVIPELQGGEELGLPEGEPIELTVNFRYDTSMTSAQQLASAMFAMVARAAIDGFLECLAGAGPEWVGAIPEDALDLARESAVELVVGEMMDTEDPEDGA